eukprot:m.254805 g.254805  ORF g.254805 m.254805 type:complete len:393 (+) comp11007_c2_seq3:2635-3813(+)
MCIGSEMKATLEPDGGSKVERQRSDGQEDCAKAHVSDQTFAIALLVLGVGCRFEGTLGLDRTAHLKVQVLHPDRLQRRRDGSLDVQLKVNTGPHECKAVLAKDLGIAGGQAIGIRLVLEAALPDFELTLLGGSAIVGVERKVPIHRFARLEFRTQLLEAAGEANTPAHALDMLPPPRTLCHLRFAPWAQSLACISSRYIGSLLRWRVGEAHARMSERLDPRGFGSRNGNADKIARRCWVRADIHSTRNHALVDRIGQAVRAAAVPVWRSNKQRVLANALHELIAAPCERREDSAAGRALDINNRRLVLQRDNAAQEMSADARPEDTAALIAVLVLQVHGAVCVGRRHWVQREMQSRRSADCERKHRHRHHRRRWLPGCQHHRRLACQHHRQP